MHFVTRFLPFSWNVKIHNIFVVLSLNQLYYAFDLIRKIRCLLYETKDIPSFSRRTGASDAPQSVKIVTMESTSGRSKPVGKVRFMYPTIYTVSCDFQVRYFPFDNQHCILEFGSWSSDSSELKFLIEDSIVRTESFMKSEEWQMIR